MKKKIFFSILLVAIVVLCVVRWDVWFGNPPEPPYTVADTPQRVLLTMGEDGDKRYVSWVCDSVPQTFWLDYVRKNSSDTFTCVASSSVFRSRSGVSCYYAAHMDRLDSVGSYQYRIRREKDTTEWYRFEVNPSTDYSFLYFGDVQDELNGGFGRVLDTLMRGNTRCSFLLFGGDFIERPMNQYWDESVGSLDSFARKLPIVAVPGNHEYLKGVTRTLEGRFPLAFPYFQKSMQENAECALYSFAQGDARFFLLDSNKDFWKLSTQRDWLKKELENSTEKWKIVVLHHPLYSTKGSMNNLMQRYYFNDLLTYSCQSADCVGNDVDLVLQGHEHVYARFRVSTDEDGRMTEPLRVVSYSSQKDYLMEFCGDVVKWGTDDRYYQRITFAGDSLVMETFGAEQGLYDKVIVVKNDHERRLIDEGGSVPERIRVSEWFRKNKSPKRVKEFEENIRKYETRGQ